MKLAWLVIIVIAAAAIVSGTLWFATAHPRPASVASKRAPAPYLLPNPERPVVVGSGALDMAAGSSRIIDVLVYRTGGPGGKASVTPRACKSFGASFTPTVKTVLEPLWDGDIGNARVNLSLSSTGAKPGRYTCALDVTSNGIARSGTFTLTVR